ISVFLTNIIEVQSTKLGSQNNISNKRREIVLNYSADANGPLLDNESDMITVRLIDNLSEGTQSGIWGLRADNGSDYADTALSPGRSMRTFLTNPQVQGSAYLLTRFIYNTKKSNTIRYVVRNEGEGSNNIEKLVILMTNSTRFTQISVVASTHIANITNIRYHVTSITLDYEPDANGSLKPGESDIISLTTVHDVPEGSTAEQYIPCLAFNWSGPVVLPVPAGYPEDSQILSFKNAPEIPLAYIYGINAAFTMNTNVEIKYKIENNSWDTPIEQLRISFDTGNFQIREIDSLGVQAQDALILEQHTNYILLDYSKVSNSIKSREGDIITLKASYHLATEFSFPMTCDVFYQGAPSWETADKKTGETNIMWVKIASWGRLIGRILPSRTVANLLLLYHGTENPVYPHGLSPLTSDEKDIAISSLSVVSQNNSFSLDFIPAGTYDLKVSADGYFSHNYKLSISITTNQITDAGTIELYSEPIDSSSLYVQKRRCINTNYDDVDILVIPTGSISEDYIADIRANYLTEEQQSDVRRNKAVQNINECGDIIAFDVKLYNLKLEDLNIYGIPLKKEWTVNIPYDEDVILAKGWQEKKLAVFYWDETVRKWMKLGGKVNASGDYVTAKISFVSRCYAVLAENTASQGKVYDVAVDNNPFTPSGSHGEYKKAKVNFRVEDGVDKVEVRIFNMAGEEVYQAKPDVSFNQGSFYWDGKDKNGNWAKGGAYMFQIRAGSFYYTGVILLIR
ncbi:MAG: FlgD immunoglobulin-like domain containing protein, partial [bacterium]|nr:FlgD immunoglobulin-like domain containing protein [bacterium]